MRKKDISIFLPEVNNLPPPGNFCEKCCKIVPDTEIKQIIPGRGSYMHIYTQLVNAYKNQKPGVIGFCAVEETIYCGKVREPNAQEYFVYHTLLNEHE